MDEQQVMRSLLLLAIGFAAGMFVCELIPDPQLEARYRAGQIDAANDVWKYELRAQPDGSTAWVRKEGE